jgi:hypothetical protein
MFKDIPDDIVKDVLAFLFAISLIVGFFMGKVQIELFVSFATLVIGHYYNETDKKHLRGQLVAKDEEIKALSADKVKIVDLNGSK